MKLTRSDVTKIVVATTAVIMLLLVQAPIYALANSPVNILGQLRAGEDPTVQFLPQIDNYTLVYQSRDKAFEAEWQQSGTLLYAYAPNSTSGDIVWVVLEIASTDGSLHNWEYCTVTYPLTQGRQAAVTQLDLRDIAIMDNPPVTARCFAFRSENRNYTQVVVYWRQTLTFTSNTTSEQQYLQINLSIYPNQPGQIQQAENTLQKFAENITAYWQPIKTWLPIALLFSKNADILALSSAFGIGLIVAVARVRYVKTVGMRAENKGGYGKLAENDKKIIGALCLTQRETIPTVNNIAVRYRNLIKQDIDESAVLARLGELNKAGLVYPEIRGVTDYPVLVWRTSDIPAPREL